VAAFVTVWTTTVRDDGNGLGFFAVVMAAGVAGFATRFRPAGMARGFFGVAVMQVLIAMAIATAPSTVNLPGGAAKVILFSGVYAILWLIAAACFRIAARGSRNGDWAIALEAGT
jgi:hypothetical protein